MEKVEEICKSTKVDCILICGDVAFSGNKDEHEHVKQSHSLRSYRNSQVAVKVFIWCLKLEQMLAKGYTREALRDAMLKDAITKDARQIEQKRL